MNIKKLQSHLIFIGVFIFILLFILPSPALAGPICTDFVSCAPITVGLIIYMYGLAILGSILLLCSCIFFVFRKNKKRFKAIGLISLVSGTVLILLNIYYIYKLEHHFTAEEKQIAKTLDFSLYMPTYTPSQYYVSHISLGNPKDKKNPYLTIDYNVGLGMHEYNLKKTKAESNPNCGPLNPELRGGIDCAQYAILQNGQKLYADTVAVYITLGNTRISLDKNLGKTNILKIINSLKQTPADKMDFFKKE